jgi:hypothetical protein
MTSLRSSFRRHLPTVRIVVRWIWFIAVLVFVVGYIRRNGGLIIDTLSGFTVLVLLSTALVTVIGKVILAIQCGAITTHLGHRFQSAHVFWMYTASDLAKYVPGGVWNAVARVKLYADAGMSRGAAGRAFALEKYWQVLGALATGAIALAPEIHRQIFGWPAHAVLVTSEVMVVVGAWALLTAVGASRISGVPVNSRLVARSIAEQSAMAIALGLGLWIPLVAVSASIDPLTAIGAFSIGRGIGYVAVFAPAGIGVREVVTLWALGRGLDTDLALVALGVNRVMTLGADLGSFAIGAGIRRRAGTSTCSQEDSEDDRG